MSTYDGPSDYRSDCDCAFCCEYRTRFASPPQSTNQRDTIYNGPAPPSEQPLIKDDIITQNKNPILAQEIYTQLTTENELKKFNAALDKFIKNQLYFLPLPLQPKIEQLNNTTKQSLVDYKYSPPYNKSTTPVERSRPGAERDDTTGDKMTGSEYVRKQYGQNYKHLRMMLQCLWEVQNTPYYSRFDIDERFKYNAGALAAYLQKYFLENDLNQAHNMARSRYKVGRPQGARNKDKVLGQDESKIFDDMLPELPDDTKVEYNNGTTETPKPNGQPDIKMQLDISQFVTHALLQSKNYVNGEQLIKVVENVGSALRKYIDEETAKIQLKAPTIIELKRVDLPPLNMGVQHRCFPALVQFASAKLRSGAHCNIWLHGPAGTGKTTAAEKLAEVFFPGQHKYRYNGAIATAFQLQGFINANGQFMSTAFREAWEHGGVYMFDEIDGSMPDALLALNGALANGLASFPDKMVPRHHQCIIVAGANTCGMGGTVQYVGRFKQDFALTNRFVFLHWPLDEALEDALCANKTWLARVRQVRRKLETGNSSIQGYTITPRASIYGEALLAAGVSQELVEHATLKQGLSDAQWNMIK